MKKRIKLYAVISILIIIGFLFLACKNSNTDGTDDSDNHIHLYSTIWIYNSTQHYMLCTCGNKIDNENHSGNPCAVCGYSNSHSHSFSADWTYNITQHWRECLCGEKTAIANHSGNPCAVCGYSNSHSHSFSADWTYNITQHWHECACGEKTTIANHSSDPCTVCGHHSFEGAWFNTTNNNEITFNGNTWVFTTGSAHTGTYTFKNVSSSGGGQFEGTWYNAYANSEITFNDNTWIFKVGGANSTKGTFSYTGTTLSLHQTHFWSSNTWNSAPDTYPATYTISGNILTISVSGRNSTKGTFTYTSTALSLNQTHYWSSYTWVAVSGTYPSVYTISDNILTISGNSGHNGTYTKR
ncbi:MAG: hypothetical protein FWE72_08950 [Spirochaetaceae bacterium]|nr:hypothetical protein [Spirochaetaceae bacterium]